MTSTQTGALVTYTARPQWGVGVVEWVAPNGRATVSFEIDGEGYADDFAPGELEPARPITRIKRTA